MSSELTLDRLTLSTRRHRWAKVALAGLTLMAAGLPLTAGAQTDTPPKAPPAADPAVPQSDAAPSTPARGGVMKPPSVGDADIARKPPDTRSDMPVIRPPDQSNDRPSATPTSPP